MKTGRAAISCFLIGLCFLPLDAYTQTTRSDWTAVMAVRSGSRLVVELRTGKPVDGRLLSATETGLTVSVQGKALDIDKANVRKVYRVGRGLSKKGVLIGVAVGTATGAGLIAGDKCKPVGIFACPDTSSMVLVGAAVGAVAGGIGGALLSLARHKRVLIYEAS